MLEVWCGVHVLFSTTRLHTLILLLAFCWLSIRIGKRLNAVRVLDFDIINRVPSTAAAALCIWISSTKISYYA